MKRVATVVLALALIGGISFAGWKIWDNRQENKNSSSQQTSDPSEGGKYLVIKEWRVRIPITVDIKDAEYTLAGSGNFITITSPRFRTIALNIPECKDSENILNLTRTREGESPFGRQITEEELNKWVEEQHGKNIEDYYYLNDKGYDCSSDELNSILNELTKAANNIERY